MVFVWDKCTSEKSRRILTEQIPKCGEQVWCHAAVKMEVQYFDSEKFLKQAEQFPILINNGVINMTRKETQSKEPKKSCPVLGFELVPERMNRSTLS